MRITVLILAFLLALAVASACQPCRETLNLKQTVEKADLIIIGEKVGEEPPSDFGEGWGGPESIDIKIKDILKGEENKTIITVNSWDAMCPYGIIINDGNDYLIILRKNEYRSHAFDYGTVDFGCNEGDQFKIENGDINIEGRVMTIDEFIAKYGLGKAEATDDNKQLIIYLLPAIALIIIVVVVLKKKGR